MLPAALSFPNISPELVAFPVFGFEFAIRWYALAYIAGILLGWWLIARLLKRPALWPKNTAPMTSEQLEAFLTWAIIGVILGGRLGYVLFYEPDQYIDDPLRVLRLWEGGMAFHGGFLGVAVAAWLFARKHAIALGPLADGLALAAPIGLFLGRVANFINAELWGRPSDVAWAVIFPGQAAQDCTGPVGLVVREGVTLCARHPSQLYEALLEGLLLGGVLLLLVARGWLKRPFALTGVFLAGYGAARTFVELFRQTDAQFIEANPPWGYVVEFGAFGLTQGQLLSLPMLLAGLIILAVALRRPT